MEAKICRAFRNTSEKKQLIITNLQYPATIYNFLRYNHHDRIEGFLLKTGLILHGNP